MLFYFLPPAARNFVAGQRTKREEHRGWSQSNRNPDLMKWLLKCSAMCFLSVTTTSSILRDMERIYEEKGLFSRYVFQNFLGLDPQRENC